MEFKDWYKSLNLFKEHKTGTFDEDGLGKFGKESWNAALLNLPTCSDCKYWNPNKFIDPEVSQCDNDMTVKSSVGFLKGTAKDFGCKFHSKIEELRKDND